MRRKKPSSMLVRWNHMTAPVDVWPMCRMQCELYALGRRTATQLCNHTFVAAALGTSIGPRAQKKLNRTIRYYRHYWRIARRLENRTK